MDLANTFLLPRFQTSLGSSDLIHTGVKSLGFLGGASTFPSHLQNQCPGALFYEGLPLFLDLYITLGRTKICS